MADEPITETTVVDEPVAEVVVDAPAAEPEVVAEDAHPLDPGGKRFSEVYGEMKDARREAQELRERLARLEGQVSTRPVVPPVPQQPRFFSPEELQAAVDRGQISPAQMANQLGWQQAQAVQMQADQRRQVEAKNSAALGEVNQYITKMPALLDQSSKEFAKVSAAAREIADDLGRPISDPVVQRRALREAFGSLDKLTRGQELRESSRQNADVHAETRGTGGAPAAKVAGKDPLKDVPQHYKDHWKKLNYTEAQMVAEAAYIKPRRR